MSNSLFSIITIAYQSEKTIERTIKSVLEQTFVDYEYILVDGASKDGTLDIVKKYEPLFKGRLKWKSEPDKGIYDAMNKGIKRCCGEIIGIVNSDDWLEPNTLSLVSNAFKSNSYNTESLYCGSILYHYKNGSTRRMDVNLASFERYAKYYIMSGIRHPATFVPRAIYNKIGLFNDNMRLSADQDFILRCYYGGVSFYKIDSILSNMTEGGISTDNTSDSIKKASRDRKLMLSNFKIGGLQYYWLYYWWRIRVFVVVFAKKILKR